MSTNHVYDPAAGVYRAGAKLSRWQDPDGDPMIGADFTGDAVCPSYARRIRPDSDPVQPGLGMAAVAGAFVGAHDIQGARPRSRGQPLPMQRCPPYRSSTVRPSSRSIHMALRATCVETATCCAWEAGYCMDNKWKIFGINGTLANFVVHDRRRSVHVTLAPQGSTKVCLPRVHHDDLLGRRAAVHAGGGARHLLDLGHGWAASATDSFLVTRTCAL